MTPDRRRPPADARRVAAEKRGRRAERAATWFLRLKGYRLLASRFKTPVGEIDLVMRRGRTIVFVEVKERPDEAAGLDAVTAKARRRIARAADYWLAGHPDAAGFDLRFDIVVASPGRLPRHHISPFDATGAAW
jgi:putative endonuclease